MRLSDMFRFILKAFWSSFIALKIAFQYTGGQTIIFQKGEI